MKKIFRLFNKYARIGSDILVRLFLRVVYLILLLPFSVLSKLCADYLGQKRHMPGWVPLAKIENEKELLIRQ